MKQQPLLIIGLLAIGAVLGATIIGSDKTDDVSPSLKNQTRSSNTISDTAMSDPQELDSVNQSLDELKNQLALEITKRKQLEEKVALIEKNLVITNSSNQNTGDEQPSSQIGDTDNPHQGGFSEQAFSRQSNDWFNEQAMLDAGVDPVKVNTIKNAFEQAEMDKLYLRDQATREGWINTKRYTDAAKEIADRTKELRNQLSDNEYDAYLYASGRPNRVTVTSMLSTSPASNAGIKPGDAIIKYDNKRVYSWSDLTSATSDGSLNDTVTVTIERDGQLQQVYLPRGPLGVRLTTNSVLPK